MNEMCVWSEAVAPRLTKFMKRKSANVWFSLFYVFLFLGSMKSLQAQSGENFDNVPVVGGYSQGTTNPRSINGWSFGLLQNTLYADAESNYLDITNLVVETDLANGSTDKALYFNGFLGEANAAQIKLSSGARFKLSSFHIDIINLSSLKIVGYQDGSIVVTKNLQTFQGIVMVTLEESEWGNIDEFRISQQNNSNDILFYIDDIVASAPVSNSPPILSPANTNADYTENSAGVSIFPMATVTDAENNPITSATISISDRRDGDVLSVGSPSPYTPTWNAGTGVLTLTGSGTPVQMQTALRTVTYSSTSDNPTFGGTHGTRQINLTVIDSEGSVSNSITSQVTITALNDAPTLAGGPYSLGT